MLLKNAKVLNEHFEFVSADLQTGGNFIEKIGKVEKTDAHTLDLEGNLVIPGFIDVHTHGCAGVDATDLKPEVLPKLSKRMAYHGVTSFAPTTMSLPHEQLLAVMDNIAKNAGKLPGARVAGIHMEGPYFSPAKAGAQDPRSMSLPSVQEVRELSAASRGLLKMISVAPELSGALDFIEKLSGDFVLSLAHTGANYDTACAAFLRGASHVTHLYNCMTGFSHREPGVVGAVFDSHRKPTAELICDGFHIHPAVIRTTLKVLGRDRVVLVSDSVRAADQPDGEYELGGLQITVKDGIARTKEGNLAGSTTNLHDCVKNMVSFGVPLELAVRAATINPARLLGIDKQTGSLAIGKQADIVVLDSDLNIKMVIIGGKLYNRGLAG